MQCTVPSKQSDYGLQKDCSHRQNVSLSRALHALHPEKSALGKSACHLLLPKSRPLSTTVLPLAHLHCKKCVAPSQVSTSTSRPQSPLAPRQDVMPALQSPAELAYTYSCCINRVT